MKKFRIIVRVGAARDFVGNCVVDQASLHVVIVALVQVYALNPMFSLVVEPVE